MDFSEIINQYGKKLFNMIYGMVGDVEEANDITQDTLVIAYKHRSQFRGEAGIYTWLYRIAINECKKYFWKKKKEKILLPLRFPHKEEEDCDLDTKIAVKEAVQGLSIKYRIPIVLKYFNNMNYEEIAETMNIPVGTVRSRLARGRKVLEEKLKNIGRWV
jgi:RNA polymerase sigma-70 factor (ECF subfamily)